MITPAIAEISFQPAKPYICDTVTVIVTRTFAADCLWRVTPSLVREGNEINIMLDISGEKACDAVITEMLFEVDVGRLPEGTYDVRVHWSDESADELARLTVVSAQCEMNGDAG